MHRKKPPQMGGFVSVERYVYCIWSQGLRLWRYWFNLLCVFELDRPAVFSRLVDCVLCVGTVIDPKAQTRIG